MVLYGAGRTGSTGRTGRTGSTGSTGRDKYCSVVVQPRGCELAEQSEVLLMFLDPVVPLRQRTGTSQTENVMRTTKIQRTNQSRALTTNEKHLNRTPLSKLLQRFCFFPFF